MREKPALRRAFLCRKRRRFRRLFHCKRLCNNFRLVFEDLIVKPYHKIESDQHDRNSNDNNSANNTIARTYERAYIKMTCIFIWIRQSNEIDTGAYQVPKKECADYADYYFNFCWFLHEFLLWCEIISLSFHKNTIIVTYSRSFVLHENRFFADLSLVFENPLFFIKKTRLAAGRDFDLLCFQISVCLMRWRESRFQSLKILS